MFYSRAEIFTQEDMNSFSLLDNDGDMMTWVKEVCDEGYLKETLELPYFQNVQVGTLDPTKYGSMIVLDSFYSINSYDSHKHIYELMQKEKQYKPLLEDMKTVCDKYEKFVASFAEDWHLKQPKSGKSIMPDVLEENVIYDSSVVPTDNVLEYVNFEKDMCEKFGPIYGMIALFPCYAFWPILFRSLGSSIPDSNVYKDWIIGNQGGNTAKMIDSFMQQKWFNDHKISDQDVKDYVKPIIRGCLRMEKTMFEQC